MPVETLATHGRFFFSEEEPADVEPFMFWVKPSTGAIKLRDSSDSSWLDVGGSSGAGDPVPSDQDQGSRLLSGGQVVWIEAYTFQVAAAEYLIDGESYESAETEVVLSAAHATLDRIDVIAVDNNGDVVVVEGTPAAQPSEPDIDPGSQLKLSIVLVKANTVEPPDLVSTSLYAENAGGPTEWDWTTSGSGFNVNSTTTPRAGSKCIEGTTTVAGAYAEGTIPSGTLLPNAYDYLVLFLRSKSTWSANRGLSVSLRSGGVLVGTAVAIRNEGTWGFNAATLGAYQVVAIPTVVFGVGSGTEIDQVRITCFGGAVNFLIDDISFQGEAIVAVPTGTTVSSLYGELTTPSPSIFSWVNQTSGGVTASVSASGGKIHLASALTQTGLHSRVRIETASVSAPFRRTMGFLMCFDMWAQNAGARIIEAGPVFRQSSDGKLHAWIVGYTKDQGAGYIASRKWTDPNTFSADYVNNQSNFHHLLFGGLIWMRIEDDNTNRICSVSSDGENWFVVDQQLRTNFLTANQVGFYFRNDSTSAVAQPFGNAGLTLFSWGQ